jgi:hypothetical protein
LRRSHPRSKPWEVNFRVWQFSVTTRWTYVVKAFADLYGESGAAFPTECSEADCRRRLEAAYPIHPELFDRLNNDWGSLDRFQRTRGVLRLMAAVINALWEQGDKSLMIMPASATLHDPTVQAELTRYLEQKWDAIISADVDGPNATPLAVDRENPNLQRYGAARRVARTIFMVSAPTYGGPNPGIDDRRIRLGCAQPGETPGSFGDALHRLAVAGGAARQERARRVAVVIS